MPTYDYECKSCGHTFDAFQSITADRLKKCPECGAMKAKRLISRTSFVLKGGGWYSDLYSSTRGDSAKSESGDSAKSESSAESTSKPDSSSKSESSSSSKPSSGKKSDSSKGSRAAA